MATTKKKTGGCKSCKKKPPIEKLPDVIDLQAEYIPTLDDIKLAYVELSNRGGVPADKREFINKVYKFLFSEDFNFDCAGCATTQGVKFQNYIRFELKIPV